MIPCAVSQCNTYVKGLVGGKKEEARAKARAQARAEARAEKEKEKAMVCHVCLDAVKSCALNCGPCTHVRAYTLTHMYTHTVQPTTGF